MAEPIRVIFRELFESGILRAFADVTFKTDLGPVTIRRFKVLQNKSGAVWVAFPQSQFQTGNSTRFAELIRADEDVEGLLRTQILNAYQAHRAAGG